MQFVRRAKEAVTGKTHESHESTDSSNHGPHPFNIANKADPRVDSDRDHYARHGTVPGGVGLESTYHNTGTNAGLVPTTLTLPTSLILASTRILIPAVLTSPVLVLGREILLMVLTLGSPD